MTYNVLIVISIAISLLFTLFAVYTLARLGVFTRIEPKIEETGGFVITKRDFSGRPNQIIDELQQQICVLKKLNIGYLNPVCIYKSLPLKMTKSIDIGLGLILFDTTKEGLIELSNIIPLAIIEKRERITVHLPYKNKNLGLLKIYPAIGRFAKRNRLIIKEITEIHNSLTESIDIIADFQAI